MKKVFAIIMSAMMLVCFIPTMAFADDAPTKTWDDNGKFKLEISSGSANAFAEVYDDYSVFGKVIGDTVSASQVSAKVTMKNVASLGLKQGEERSHEIGFNTPLTQIPELPRFFPHIFGCDKPNSLLYPDLENVAPFDGATIVGKVNGYEFTYTVSAVAKGTEKINEKETTVYTMTATPNKEDVVRRAWHELTSKVEATTSTGNDSKIEIPAGAYLQIGTQKLLFDKSCDVNPSANGGIAGANQAIRDAATLYTVDKLTNNIEMYIPKDSVLRVGDSIATLKAGVYIKSNSKAITEDALKTLKGDPETQIENQLTEMIIAVLKILDSAVEEIDNCNLNITVLTECYVDVNGTVQTYVYGDAIKLDAVAGKKWVDADKKEVKNGDIVTCDMVLTQVDAGGSVPGGGGAFVPVPVAPVETPIDKAKTEANTAISSAASENKYDEAEQAEIKAILDKAANDIKNAKTEEEIKAIQEAAQEEIEKVLTSEENAQIKSTKAVNKEVFKTKSKYSKLKGKKAVKISWNVPKGMKLDGFEIYRSTKKNSGYGKTPYFTTKKTSYTNSKGLVKGKTYYYKVRAFVEINGERYYTGYSTKSFRVIK